MKPIELHRTFSVSGTNPADFLKAVENMTAITSELVVPSMCVGMSAVITTPMDVSEIAITSAFSPEPLDTFADRIWADVCAAKDGDKITLYRYRPGQRFRVDHTRASTIRNLDGMTELLFDEICNSSKTMISIYPTDINEDPKTYFVSDLAFSTLNNRARLGGDAMSKPTVGRVVECAKAFYLRRPQNIKLIIRTIGKTRVIIAAHSSKYCYVPQTVLSEIYERITKNLGHTECLYWEVNHELSCCYVGFPDIAESFANTYKLPAKIIPGLYMSTSDSGDGSLIIRGIWNINGYNVGGEAIKRNHRGEIDVGEFVDSAYKTIFAKYNSVPERLTELLAIDVPNPKETIKSVFKQIELSKSTNLGSTAAKELLEALVSEIDPSAKYTAYDIACSLLTVPERCIGDHHHSFKEKLEALMLKAIFANYSPKKKSKEPSIVLA